MVDVKKKSSAKKDKPAKQAEITLPESADISAASRLKEQLLSAFSSGGEVVFDADKVQRITTPAMQLLLAAAHKMERMVIMQPSEAFARSADDLGVKQLLKKAG